MVSHRVEACASDRQLVKAREKVVRILDSSIPKAMNESRVLGKNAGAARAAL